MTWLLPALLIAAVILAWARLARWQARSPARSRAWRIALLAAMQPIIAGLLYLTLQPPPAPGTSGTLIVVTAGASSITTAGTVVALPEAPAISGAERVPDLATALRRHPVARLRIIGGGLEARDLDAARGLALAFDLPADPHGIIRLDPPPPSAPGGSVRIGGQVAGVPGGQIDLLDPAGTRIDRQPLSAQGDFTVTGTARVAGANLVRLIVRDASGATVDQADVPILTADDPQPRLLLLAGAPGPEIKYLRRWATDAGLAVTTRIAAGGGVTLGDAPVAIDPATLARIDVVVIDERSWTGLSARERSALVTAVRGGMGLVARITGPLPASVRSQWRAFGIAIGNAATTAPVTLGGDAPPLYRRLVGATPDAIPIWRDARGAILADWRASGRGRVAVWTLDQSFALVLGGQADRYGAAWGNALAAVARPRGRPTADIPPLPRAGERITLCAIGNGARIAAPGDGATLAIDSASNGCAGYWPRHPGWHTLVDRDAAQPFYVYPAQALPGVRAHDRADATARLRNTDARAAAATERGASWPWFLALLAATSALWWFERTRLGRTSPQSGAISG